MFETQRPTFINGTPLRQKTIQLRKCKWNFCT